MTGAVMSSFCSLFPPVRVRLDNVLSKRNRDGLSFLVRLIGKSDHERASACDREANGGEP